MTGTFRRGPGSRVDITFKNALAQYHEARYVYSNGKPISKDATGGAAEQPPLFDVKDIQNQIHNDVVNQYLQVFGVRPDEG